MNTSENKPRFIILAGPNGAGKSTSARRLLEACGGLVPFVNADTIAEGLAGFSPQSAAMLAGRIMVERIQELAEKRRSFAVETTLASRSYAALIRETLAEYEITMLFLHLRSEELAIERVKHRVAQGGHAIPESIVQRRYHNGLRNFFKLYRPLVHKWMFYNNSDERPVLWAAEDKPESIRTKDFDALEQRYAG